MKNLGTFFTLKSRRTSSSWILFACVLVPTLLLSWAPHQEFRFLLPLFVPLAILSSPTMFGPGSRPLLKVFFFLFNIGLLVVVGFALQGGVVASLLKIQHDMTSTPSLRNADVVFFRTYTPPTYLLLLPPSSPSRLFDLHGETFERLNLTLSDSTSV